MKKLAAAFAAMMFLTGCVASEEVTMSGGIEISNVYVRATDAMSGMDDMLMTGVFMDIVNNTDADLTLTGGSTEIAMRLEVHEVVDGVMRQKEGGLMIPAGGMQTLKPGGNHVMLIGLDGQLAAGEEVALTLTFSDGQSVQVVAPVKVVNLDQEHYDSGSPSPSMSHNM